MQQHTVKTTLTFSPGFLQKVRTIAQERQWSMSRVIENDLIAFLKEQEQQKLDRMYVALRKFQGGGSPGITDASTTIDETLYGDEGAWKGQPAK